MSYLRVSILALRILLPICVLGLKASRSTLRAPPWSSIVTAPHPPACDATSPELVISESTFYDTHTCYFIESYLTLRALRIELFVIAVRYYLNGRDRDALES